MFSLFYKGESEISPHLCARRMQKIEKIRALSATLLPFLDFTRVFPNQLGNFLHH